MLTSAKVTMIVIFSALNFRMNSLCFSVRVTVRAVSVSRQTPRVLVGEAPQSPLTSPVEPAMS